MEIDFEKIKNLEQEIQKLLEERSEYKEWFYSMRKEVNDIANKNKNNRCNVALDIMMEKWLEILEVWKLKEE